ncbi:MAG: acetyl-CoA carboxylase biotin carboxyl carrier protein, partial [Gemmatimonadetes bacterium]|nr:acetyl-CoA carboxylase biotin carboxyl carrier protein [Gemmatimonadota bacterium]
AEASAPAGDAAESPSADLVDVTSPMVGTFYRAPSPEAPPYVDVGAKVAAGDVLCVIEAMKLMNELECEVSGRIVEICADNAEPVDYGQLLFRVDPA